MEHAFAEIELSNPREPELRPLRVRALTDTGALMLCIPEHVALQLGLETESEREVTVADDRKSKVPYVGPVRVAFDGRSCFVGALVVGDEVLLGSVPMEDMDLVISPARREVTVNPDSPNIPHARVKVHRSRPGPPSSCSSTGSRCRCRPGRRPSAAVPSPPAPRPSNRPSRRAATSRWDAPGGALRGHAR